MSSGAVRLRVVAAVLVVAGVAYAVVMSPLRTGFSGFNLWDAEVYRMGGRMFLDGTPLYDPSSYLHTSTDSDLPFTYPPISAVLFAPLAWLPVPAADAVMTLISVLALLWLVQVVARRVGVAQDGSRASRYGEYALIAAVAGFMEPVRITFGLGQINLLLIALIVADTLWDRIDPRYRGFLTGVAAALKLTPLVFLVYFLIKRQYRCAANVLTGFGVTTALGFALIPRDSAQYWRHTLWETSRIGSPAFVSNQGFAAPLSRMGMDAPLRFALLGLFAAGVLVGFGYVIKHLIQRGETVLAVCVTAGIGYACTPTSWVHHWIFSVVLIGLLGLSAYRTRSLPMAVLAAAGMVIEFVGVTNVLPGRFGRELQWNTLQHVVGSSYLIWLLAVVAVLGLAVRRGWPIGVESGLAATGSPAQPQVTSAA